MFKLELIELLTKYRNSDNSQTQEIRSSIKKLIKENNYEFEEFKSQIDQNSQNYKLLDEIYNEKEDYENNENNKDDVKKEVLTDEQKDVDLIKDKYKQWLLYYDKNGKIPDENCINIIKEVINFYILNRFDILQNILEINDTTDFEAFKNMLKNLIRDYYATNLKKYMNSQSYEDLGFLAKIKKNKQIEEALNKLGKYDFNIGFEKVIT
jgi:hypothetical protein